jgi:hypothetical protein
MPRAMPPRAPPPSRPSARSATPWRRGAGTLAPNLLGVVVRKAGSTDFSMYSPQLTYGKVWTGA